MNDLPHEMCLEISDVSIAGINDFNISVYKLITIFLCEEKMTKFSD